MTTPPTLLRTMPPDASPAARAAIHALTASKIREVANAGMGRAGVLPFWFGEPDQVTPRFIRDAAAQSLAAGETFYSHNCGLPSLREAIAAHVSRLHRPRPAEDVIVASAGVNALMLAHQALLAPADRVLAIAPVWPNLIEAPRILSARVATFALDFDGRRGFTLDLDRLLAELTPNTRLLIVNSPGNPTGWTATRAEQAALLAHCRRHGIWILADDAYERLYFDAPAASAAPSFLDLAERYDRVVSANTFSKSWLMTGWRLGWIVAPPELAQDIGKIVEYNTSCAPVFVQRAGEAALRDGEATTQAFVARLAHARDLLHRRLNEIDGVEAVAPPGAMYAFFRIAGESDSLALCKRLVAEQGLGLAPGVAFGPGSEGFVRWCFAASDANLEEGVRRLRAGLKR